MSWFAVAMNVGLWLKSKHDLVTVLDKTQRPQTNMLKRLIKMAFVRGL